MLLSNCRATRADAPSARPRNRGAHIPVLVASDGKHQELVRPRSAGDKVASLVDRVSARNSTHDWWITRWAGGSACVGEADSRFPVRHGSTRSGRNAGGHCDTTCGRSSSLLGASAKGVSDRSCSCSPQRVERDEESLLAFPVKEWPAASNTCSRVSSDTSRSPSPQQSINVTKSARVSKRRNDSFRITRGFLTIRQSGGNHGSAETSAAHFLFADHPLAAGRVTPAIAR